MPRRMWMPRGDARAWTGGGLPGDALVLQAPDLSGGELSAVQDILLPHKGSIILKGYADAGEYAGCGGVGQSDQEIFRVCGRTTWAFAVGSGGLVSLLPPHPSLCPQSAPHLCPLPRYSNATTASV